MAQPVPVLNGDDPAVCVVCPSGHYCPDGLVMNSCPEGKYNPQQLASSEDACVSCPSGTTTSVDGAEREGQCVAIQLSCAPGTAGLACDPCGPGTFSVGGNVQACGECEPGTVSTAAQLSIRCDACPAGTYMPNARSAQLSACVDCGPGLRSTAGSAACSGCSAGSYLVPESGECGQLPPLCNGNGTACLPGVPEPVAAPDSVSDVLFYLPLPVEDEEASSAFDTVTNRFGRSAQAERDHLSRVLRTSLGSDDREVMLGHSSGPRDLQDAGEDS